MRTACRFNTDSNMKNLKLVILLLLSPLAFYGQQLTGLWIGSLSTDTNTIRKDQSFEIALTEYRGKVYGYSRNTFIVNDTLYYIVKRLKGTIEGNTCEVKDDDIISCNFSEKLEKKVKVIHTFRLNESDSTWQLDGNWKTTKTKNYYSISGKSDLGVEKDIDKSKIFPHLEELNLAKDIPFYITARKQKDEEIAKQLEAGRIPATSIRTEQQSGLAKGSAAKSTIGVKTTTIPVTNEVVSLDERTTQTNVTTEQQSSLAKSRNTPGIGVKTNTVPITNEVVSLDERANQTNVTTEAQKGINMGVNKPIAGVRTNTVPVSKEIVSLDQRTVQTGVNTEQQSAINKTTDKPAGNVKTSTVAVNTKIVTPQEQKTVATTPPPVINKAVTPGSNGVVTKPVAAVAEPVTIPTATNTKVLAKNVVEDPTGAALQINNRRTDAQQTVEFRADSVVIAVYDNGEIDGDTVSVLLNGEVVLAKQGLKASAAKKTLFFPANTDEEFTLVLYAENLGKYPPNTGLLVIYDGDDRHYVRFSADLQKNAGVILRRKR
jgi:hypothetical protein